MKGIFIGVFAAVLILVMTHFIKDMDWNFRLGLASGALVGNILIHNYIL
ncbi:hypothetical protein N9948_00715 [bacterium]|nr:hypothetical protein [bacterium]